MADTSGRMSDTSAYRTPQMTPSRGTSLGGGGGACSVSRSLLRSARASNRFTPFRKTPSTRRLLATPGRSLARATLPTDKRRRTSRQRQQQPDDDDHQEIVRQTWKTFKLTPLYQFSYNERVLRKYASSLAAFILTETKKGSVLLPGEQTDKATFRVLRGFKFTTGDSDAVEITLKAKGKKGQEDAVVLRAVLSCVHQHPEDLDQSIDGVFTLLPVMLVQGTVALIRPLCDWLQNQFGCGVSPLKFSPTSLCWLVAMWAGFVPEKNPKSVQLVYETPSQIENLSRITMDIHPTDCKALWDSIHSRDDSFYEEQEMEAFLNALEAHFSVFFKIHFSALKLSRVGTPVAYVKSEGKLKIFSEEFVPMVMGKLTELALDEVIPHKC